jgi:hypothetical protein
MSRISSIPAVSGQDLFSSSSIQNMPFGAYAESTDGRGFRYCGVGAVSTVAGKVYQGIALDATNLQPSGGLAVAAAAIGATQVTLTGSLTIAANLVAGGYLSVDVTPGQGYLYKIASNTAVAAATGCVITLEDPLIVALTTSSKVILIAHPYSAVVVAPATATSVIVGVAPSMITNAQFGWMQTFGPASVLFTGTGVAGGAVGTLVGGTIGSAAPSIAGTNILGTHMATGITAEYAFIFLNIR